MNGGIFITAKDVQKLMGCERYATAFNYLRVVKDALGKKSKYLTIKEFCDFDELDFEYVWKILRPDIDAATLEDRKKKQKRF
jgi:hypothetical protein